MNDEAFKTTQSFQSLIKKYFQNIEHSKIIVDNDFIEFFDILFRYIQTKYPFEIEKNSHDFVYLNSNYMDLYSLNIIQIMYNMSIILNDEKIYNLENIEDKYIIMYYTLTDNLLSDIKLKTRYKEEFKKIYTIINKELEKNLKKT
jgi:hypothetical protein